MVGGEETCKSMLLEALRSNLGMFGLRMLEWRTVERLVHQGARVLKEILLFKGGVTPPNHLANQPLLHTWASKKVDSKTNGFGRLQD